MTGYERTALRLRVAALKVNKTELQAAAGEYKPMFEPESAILGSFSQTQCYGFPPTSYPETFGKCGVVSFGRSSQAGSEKSHVEAADHPVQEQICSPQE